MKQRISEQDLLELTRSQRSTLRGMWQPEMYDAAVVMVCTDVAADHYQTVPFIIGGVEVESINSEKKYEIRTMPVYSYDYCIVWLQNFGFQENPEEAEQSIEADPEETDFDDTEYEDAVFDESAAYDLSQPAAWYNKEDCLPLLGIGQMLALIEANKPQSVLRLTWMDDSYVCTIDGMEFEGEELCDVLWEILKGLL